MFRVLVQEGSGGETADGLSSYNTNERPTYEAHKDEATGAMFRFVVFTPRNGYNAGLRASFPMERVVSIIEA